MPGWALGRRLLGQRPPWPELCSAATDDPGPGALACARPTRGTRRHGSVDPARTQRVGSHPDGIPHWPPRGLSFPAPTPQPGIAAPPFSSAPSDRRRSCSRAPHRLPGPTRLPAHLSTGVVPPPPAAGGPCRLTPRTGTFPSFSVPFAHTEHFDSGLSYLRVCRITHGEVRAEFAARCPLR